MSEQVPHYEAGQILHNNPVGYPCPAYVHALITAIRREICRVYWNVNQTSFYGSPDLEYGDKRGTPPLGIPGMEWRAYYNWGGSPDDEDWDQTEANAPNFSFEDVDVRWYKHFGRSMNVNVQMNEVEWVAWFNRALDVLDLYQERHHEMDANDVTSEGSAPYRCPQCSKFFSWPARRCPYDATALVGYKLTKKEREQQAVNKAARLARIQHGTPSEYRIEETQDLGFGWKAVIAEKAKGEMPFDFGGWYILLLRPDGCIGSSFGASEEMVRRAFPEHAQMWQRTSKKESDKAMKTHLEGGW